MWVILPSLKTHTLDIPNLTNVLYNLDTREAKIKYSDYKKISLL